jgi:uncharacterized protein YjiS (DUF1127 family)
MMRYQEVKRLILAALERQGRARTLALLRGMDPRSLSDMGFSPALLRQGVRAWPWRVEEDVEATGSPTKAGASRTEIRTAVAELRTYTDAELADLGISRRVIPEVVRRGRPEIDDIAA